MKSKRIRVIVPIVVGLVVAIGFVANVGVGSLSSFGWGDISLLCPLGALTTMLASKTFVPRALISLVIAVVLILALGRLFCGWICPVPVINKLPQLFKKKEDVAALEKQKACAHSCLDCSEHAGHAFDSRHLVLLGTLLSATVFGFPVFCLVCPIGLAFATVFLVIALFSGGDLTWSVLVVPALLLLEIVVFKKWCGRICPLSALMSLLGKANSSMLRPTVDEGKCLEERGRACGRCGIVCEVGIDPRHPDLGVGFNECIKCRECVEACPAHAITMPLLSKKVDGRCSSKEEV